MLAVTLGMMATPHVYWTRRATLATLAVGLLSACSGAGTRTGPSNGGDSSIAPDGPDAAATEAKPPTSWDSTRQRRAAGPLRPPALQRL